MSDAVSAVAADQARAERALREAFRDEQNKKAASRAAVDATAAAVVNAHDAMVPWSVITDALGGVARQSAVDRVAAWERRQRGQRSGSFDGTTTHAEPGTGLWAIATVRAAAEDGAALVGAAIRRIMLEQNQDPGQIVAAVRAGQVGALLAAADAVTAADPDSLDEAAAAKLAREVAAGFQPETLGPAATGPATVSAVHTSSRRTQAPGTFELRNG